MHFPFVLFLVHSDAEAKPSVWIAGSVIGKAVCVFIQQIDPGNHIDSHSVPLTQISPPDLADCAAGIAIGGDVFPGSTLSDHCLRYQNIPDIKLIVVLGELGGHDEYSLVDALKSGKISKPVVAWVSGTCAKLFKSEVQFGHAGAKSGGASESAQVDVCVCVCVWHKVCSSGR